MRLYRIKLTGLGTSNYWQTIDVWVRGLSYSMPKVGGDGEFWSNPRLAEKAIKGIQEFPGYGTEYTVKLITYNLVERVEDD
jgi:hypothetical protein